MRRTAQGYYLLVWLGIGIGAATLAANRLFASGLVNYQVLYQYMVQGWQNGAAGGSSAGGSVAGSGRDSWAVIEILAVRLAELAVVAFVCRRAAAGGRFTGIGLLLAYMGAATGLSVVLMTWCRGFAGIFCCLAACLPHYLFYLTAWGIIILQALGGYEIRKGRFWPVIGLLMIAGIMAEIWLNPFFLRFV